MSKRTCGDCIVCCVYPRITSPTLEKPPLTHCPNLTLPANIAENSVLYSGPSKYGNCKIYPSCGEEEEDKRPECCSGYKCLWLLGHGNEEDRPDKSLILFDSDDKIENAVKAKPLVEKKEESEDGVETINRMSVSTGKPIIVFDFCEHRIVRIVGTPIKERR